MVEVICSLYSGIIIASHRNIFCSNASEKHHVRLLSLYFQHATLTLALCSMLLMNILSRKGAKSISYQGRDETLAYSGQLLLCSVRITYLSYRNSRRGPRCNCIALSISKWVFCRIVNQNLEPGRLGCTSVLILRTLEEYR